MKTFAFFNNLKDTNIISRIKNELNVYVNQQDFVSDIQALYGHDFINCENYKRFIL